MKTKKFLKIALLVVIAALFIWTFVFLYQKSQPKVTVYETIVPEVTDLEKTTVATGKVEPRDEVLIKPQISGIIAEVYKEAGQSVKQGGSACQSKGDTRTGTIELCRKPRTIGGNQRCPSRNGFRPYPETVQRQAYQR